MTEPTAAEPGEFIVVFFGDLHIDNSVTEAEINTMMEYVKDNASAMRISAVLVSGDLTDGTWIDTTAATVFKNAAANISNIPHLIGLGNHDHTAAVRIATDYNTLFGQDYYTDKSWWSGGFYETGESINSYLLKTIENINFIFMNIEMFPRQAVIDWANTILTTYANRTAIILMHAYEYSDNTPYSVGDTNGPDGLNGVCGVDYHWGDEVWDELLKLHDNIILVVSGHKSNTGRHAALSDGGKSINQLLFDYEYGGTSKTLMRFMRIHPTNGTLKVETYSPVTGLLDTGTHNQFTMSFEKYVAPDLAEVRVPRKRPYRRVLNPYATTIAECYELVGK